LPVTHWAVSAHASSEWSATDWSAIQATGAPELANCLSAETNWSPLGGGPASEWLETDFATPVAATGVRVLESGFEAGFVTQIDLVDTAGAVHTVWSGTDAAACGETFFRTWAATPYLVDGVIVHTQVDDWEEIDAVELVAQGAPAPDGVGDVCDLCPGITGPHDDFDADGVGDDCDCAPNDYFVSGPVEVSVLDVDSPSPGAVRLTWSSTQQADSYAVSRVLLGALGPGEYGSCHASGLATTEHEDDEIPSPGEGFGYLVQAINAVCGAGPLGFGPPGVERSNANLASCR